MGWKAWSLLILSLLLSPCATFEQAIGPTPPYKNCMSAGLGQSQFRQCGEPAFEIPTLLYVAAFEETWNKTDWLPQNRAALRSAIARIDLHWQPEIFYSPHHEDKRRLLGLTYGPSYGRQQMYVAKTSHFVEYTALGHELLHVAYLAIEDDSVGDHFGDKYEWPADHLEFLRRVEQLYRKKLDGKLADLRIQR